MRPLIVSLLILAAASGLRGRLVPFVRADTGGGLRADQLPARTGRGARLGPDAATAPRPAAAVLLSIGGLSPQVVSAFQEPVAFSQTPSGSYLVFDRRAQAVFSVGAAATQATRVVTVGEERGRIIRPTAFAMARDGTFVVIDAPVGRQRLQRFAERGYLLDAFLLPPRPVPNVVVEGFVVGSAAWVQYTGDSIFISEPWTDSLFTEYTWDGDTRRTFGRVRTIAGQTDREVHVALNAGIPLVDPTGGFWFVFQTGIPAFRKYDQAGTLVFERHIEGRELDEVLQTQAESWPKRVAPNRAEYPAVPLVVRTAGVDSWGRLWVALQTPPVVYVYTADGDKLKTLQLRAPGPVAPLSLFFASPARLLVTPGCSVFDSTLPGAGGHEASADVSSASR
jgi:hypothetical protein